MGTASQGSMAWRAGVLEAVESMESCERGRADATVGKASQNVSVETWTTTPRPLCEEGDSEVRWSLDVTPA